LLHEQVTGFRMRHPFVPVEEEFEDVPFVRTDANRVAQIITNLLENAAKYGGDMPRITTRLRATPGSVHIDVRDGGLGIPLDEQERIFDRAYRLSQRVGQTAKAWAWACTSPANWRSASGAP
jgi:two-component system phosphate regulon sensor histidine kinase PhoR